jgi:endosialidase-like protein
MWNSYVSECVMKISFITRSAFIGFTSMFVSTLALQAQSTVFTYQGRVLDNGTNFTGTGRFKFALVTSTNANHTAMATANISGNFVTTYNVTSGGNGYTNVPAVAVLGGGGSGATATASISGGVVTGITANNPGAGYTNAPTVLIAPPPPSLSYTTYWSNDGTSSAGGEPSAAVSVGVSNGLFTVVLGDNTVANMAAISTSLFAQPNLQLRIWFSDGASGFAALDPAQNLTPAPYAISAGIVNASNISSGKLPDERLSANVALLNGNQTFTGQNTFNNALSVAQITPASTLTIAGDAEVGTSSGDYRHLRLGGGNSSGFLYGSYPYYNDFINLGYNFYADAAGIGHAINPGGGTSRISVGYGSITMATGYAGQSGGPETFWTMDQYGSVNMSSGLTIGSALYVYANAYKPGGGSWSATSDERLKKNIQPLGGVLDKLLALHGVTFEFKEPEKIHELPGERIGMVAQDVEKVFPDWVSTGKDGYKRLTYRGFEALTVEALRQLRAEKDEKIEELEKQNENLQKRLEKLEQAIDRNGRVK